jgi:hypothetical protein
VRINAVGETHAGVKVLEVQTVAAIQITRIINRMIKITLLIKIKGVHKSITLLD